jgi:putative nucleotidyltransferase with HDIG domain
MANEQQKLQQILNFSLEITQMQDIDILLEKILSVARKLVNADAGYIYIKEGGKLQCRHVHNETLQKQVAPGKKLAFPTFSIPISERSISGYVAITGETLNIPDISFLPDDQPYSSDKYYDESSRYHTYSLLVVPLKRNREEIIGVMNLINARNDEGAVIPFAEDDVPFIRIFANHVSVSIERAQTTRTRILGMIRVLTELHDPEETEAHVNRVGAYSAEIYEAWARKKGMSQAKIEADAEILRMASMLHDLGKLAIPYKIWKKPERLTTEEYEIIKQHTVKGAQMLHKSAQTEYEEVAVQIALNHHEYWNGEGYPGHVDLLSGEVIPGYEDEQGKPRGKKGEEIPVFGRVVAIADVYDSLLCRRIYRTALKEPQVLKILKKESGKHFDPEMIDAFFSSLDTIHAIARQFPNEGH